MDDTHTWFLMHLAERPGTGAPLQTSIRFREIPGSDAAGRFITDMANGQDHMATVTQGAVAAREREHLGTSDTGIVMYRELLAEQLAIAARGDDPINVLRGTGPDLIDFPRPAPPTRGGGLGGRVISYNSSRI